MVLNEILFVVSFPKKLISSFHPTHLLKQLATILDVATEYLYLLIVKITRINKSKTTSQVLIPQPAMEENNLTP